MRVNKAEESYQESRFNWLLLLLAILINLIILFFLFLVTLDSNFWEFQKNKFDQPEVPVLFEEMPMAPEPQPEIKPDEVAALKPGASHFGMPDEFKEDEFIATMPEQPNPQEDFEAANTTSDTVMEISEKPMKKIDPESEPTITHLAETQELIKTQTVPMQQKQEETKSLSLLEQLQEQKTPKKELPQQPEPQKIRAPIKKELTFNELAQGFLSSLDEGGNDLMERKGNENIRPDFEEMRYLSYLHKIVWYMQNEWRRDNTIINCGPPVMVVTGVSVTIDKNGVLKKASIVQSCGNNQLDEAIIRGIYAASPYPPLPAHLNKEVLTVEFGVKHIGYNNNRSRVNFHFG